MKIKYHRASLYIIRFNNANLSYRQLLHSKDKLLKFIMNLHKIRIKK